MKAATRLYIAGPMSRESPDDGVDIPDLAAALKATITAAREQRERDNLPCPKCGGDRLRADFTGSGRCHVPRSES